MSRRVQFFQQNLNLQLVFKVGVQENKVRQLEFC